MANWVLSQLFFLSLSFHIFLFQPNSMSDLQTKVSCVTFRWEKTEAWNLSYWVKSWIHLYSHVFNCFTCIHMYSLVFTWIQLYSFNSQNSDFMPRKILSVSSNLCKILFSAQNSEETKIILGIDLSDKKANM